MTVEDLLAELTVDTQHSDIPDEARAATVRQLVDCVGVTLAAAADPAGAIITALSSDMGERTQARVLGTGVGTSAVQAAWANGALAHLLDFDDTGFSHPTACIMPVALALGEQLDASGRELVTALVLGYEVFERLAASARVHEPVLRSRGLHPTSIWGAPAAAAAAGRLLDLDHDQMRVALGIAASSASGLAQQFGTWAKGLNAGNAARAGVTAGLLAHAGYAGDKQGITGRYGLFSAMVGEGNYDLGGVESDLGERWAIVDPGLSIKPYPACTSTLRAVDAMLAIASRPHYSPDAVERIVVHVHPDLLHTLRFCAPTSGFRGKFSLDYTVASAALDATLTLESFSDAAAGREALRIMLGKVELRLHPEWDMSRRHDNPVEVVLAGRVHISESVEAHRGSRKWPLSTDEIVAKYLACARRCLDADQAAASLAPLWSVNEAPSMRRVIDHLVIPA